MAAYYQASRVYHTGALPPPPDLQPVVDKTAEYVAKNGDKFETTVIFKHLSDPRFGFLHPWNQYNHYYKTKVAEFREGIRTVMGSAPASMQKLSNSGAVSFKMTAKVATPTLSSWSSAVEEEDGRSNDENGGSEGESGEPLEKKVKLNEDDMMDTTVKVW